MQKSALPTLIFSTRTGTPYNLTPSNQPDLQAIQLSAGDFLNIKKVLENLPADLPFKKFIGCKSFDVKTYLTPYDFSKPKSMNGCNGDKIKLLGNQGYQEVTSYDYFELVKLVKPDYWVGLTEIPVLLKDHTDQSTNAFKRAIGKTNSFFRQIPSTDRIPGMLAAIHGGRNHTMLNKSIEECLKYDVAGFVLCDLCENQSLLERQSVYKSVIDAIHDKAKETNRDYIIVLAGLGKIQDIIHAKKFGITNFEVNEPFRLASIQQALLLKDGITVSHKPVLLESLEPLDRDCKCSTCLNYSQAYIAHLINCHQLTAKVLLSIHNVFQYLRCFSS